MVIFDDLHKLLLYQKLNLGFECQVCKKKFYNRLDHLQHTSNCKEQFKCSKCGKVFGHHQILQLHMQFHNLSKVEDCQEKLKTKTECVTLIEPECVNDTSFYDNVIDQETTPDLAPDCVLENQTAESKIEQEEEVTTETNTNTLLSTNDISTLDSHNTRPIIRNRTKAKKKVGLTKIKMEDCLRCDECSCIYIDEKDYYKHMRNFHQLDVANNMPITRQKTKRKCRSCCKQCRGTNCIPYKKPRATHPASNLIFKINMRDNIQNRWTRMVSQQLSNCPMTEHIQLNPHIADLDMQIKPDPDSVTIKTEHDDTPDLSHLLSQVEVKIKTEPADTPDLSHLLSQVEVKIKTEPADTPDLSHLLSQVEVKIKTEPADSPDLSHLLSQVEVKIKTEPADDYIV